jgi:hypothetical protein
VAAFVLQAAAPAMSAKIARRKTRRSRRSSASSIPNALAQGETCDRRTPSRLAARTFLEMLVDVLEMLVDVLEMLVDVLEMLVDVLVWKERSTRVIDTFSVDPIF